MDNTLQNPKYRALPAKDGDRASRDLLSRVAAVGGGVSILWHNNRFDRRTAEGYDDVYFGLVDKARADGAFVGRADAVVRRFVRAHRRQCARRERAPERGAVIRVVHLSVVHKPDDPRIYERECRTLAGAGYQVMYLAPGAERRRDEHGVLTAPLPERSRSTRFLSTIEIAKALRGLRPQVLHVHDPELLTLFPAVGAFMPRLVYDMHEYLPEQVANKEYIPEKVRPYASQATALAQKNLAALAGGVVVVTPRQLDAIGEKPQLRVVLPNYPRLARFEGAEPVPDLGADPRLKLIYVGSLSRARGCLLMLDVMEQLEPGRGAALPRRRLRERRARSRGAGAGGGGPARPRRPPRPHPAAGAAALPGGGRRRLVAEPRRPAVRPADGGHQDLRGHGLRAGRARHQPARAAARSCGSRSAASPCLPAPTAISPASGACWPTAARSARWASAVIAPSRGGTPGRPSRAIW